MAAKKPDFRELPGFREFIEDFEDFEIKNFRFEAEVEDDFEPFDANPRDAVDHPSDCDCNDCYDDQEGI